MKLSRRQAMSGICGGLLAASRLQARPAPPNIVLIISDDLGYSDLPRFGSSRIPTPHLDGLAARGTVFTQAYVTAPVCVPSRMGIVTGRYQQRFGIYDNMYRPHQLRLFNEETTIADQLRKAGYATKLVGKWHMSGNGWPLSGPPPEARGFDQWVGIGGGMSKYFPPVTLYRNSQPFEAPEYLTDYFGEEAERFVRGNRERPFFLYLAFNAPHAPLEAKEHDREGLDEAMSPDRRTYAGMVRAMDRNIGRVLSALREMGLEENTLIAFVNDNGGGGNHTPPHTRNTGRNAPLRGFKFEVFEGGIRVPMMISWPGRIASGQRYERAVSSMDLAPTFLRAAGIAPPEDRPFDGVDLVPFLAGDERSDPHPVLCWENRAWLGPRGQQRPAPGQHNKAIRKGKWKLVQVAGRAEWELFDLAADPGEQHDLAAEFPGVVEDLRTEFERWRRQMPEPLPNVVANQ